MSSLRFDSFINLSVWMRRARCSVRAEAADCSLSVSVLKRHVQTLRRRIRQLEEHFEQERLKVSGKVEAGG